MNAFEMKFSRQVLLEWLMGKSSLDHLLSQISRENHWGSRERVAIQQTVYNFIRFYPSQFRIKADFDALKNIRKLEEVIEEVSQKSRESLVRDHEKCRPKFADAPLEHLHEAHGIDRELLSEIPEPFAPLHQFVTDTMFSEAPLTLRLAKNDPRKPALIEALVKRGFAQSPWLENAFSHVERISLQDFAKDFSGAYEVQDEHSQWVAPLILENFWATGAERVSVLDYCAGAGGKTLHLADELEGRGEVYYFDSAYDKIKKLKERLKRRGGGEQTRHVFAFDSRDTQKKFDLVLVDVPCSGWGTLRRNPELLYRLNRHTLRKLQLVQREILEKASRHLKDGGVMAYTTCSVLPNENIQTVQGYCRDKEKRLQPLESSIRRLLGAKAEQFFDELKQTSAYSYAEQSSRQEAFSTLQLGPSSQASGSLKGDGFFISLVK